MMSYTTIITIVLITSLLALLSCRAESAIATATREQQNEMRFYEHDKNEEYDDGLIQLRHVRYLQQSTSDSGSTTSSSSSSSYLSEQCRNDTDLMFANNSTLALAAEALDGSLPNDPGCTQLSSSTTNFDYHCTYGYPEAALQQYEATCLAQGGQVATVDSVTVVCTVRDTNTTTADDVVGSITIDFESFSDCVAATCDLSLVDAVFGDFGSYLVNKMEDAIPSSECALKQEQKENMSSGVREKSMGGAYWACLLLSAAYMASF